MPRKTRVEYPWPFHHVLSRGDRRQFEARMEGQRPGAQDEAAIKGLRRGWRLGSEFFRMALLERMQGRLGDHHAGIGVTECLKT